MITIQHVRYRHEGGTKFYTLSMICIGNMYVMVKRWGKTGARGSIKIEPVSNITSGMIFAKERQKRESKGYVVESGKELFEIKGDSSLEISSEIENIVGRNPIDSSKILQDMVDEEVRGYSMEHGGSSSSVNILPKKIASSTNTAWGDW